MDNEEIIKNLQARINIMSNTMVEMFKVVAVSLPSTEPVLRELVRVWEEAEKDSPLPLD